MAKRVNKNMLFELEDLVARRWKILDAVEEENNKN
jgi:hypothetical protein